MALSFKDQETDSLARAVAMLTGESLTQAVRTSLSERLARERLKRGKSANVSDSVEQIVREYKGLPTLDPRSPDEIIGYDENGLPS